MAIITFAHINSTDMATACRPLVISESSSSWY
eukprot:CAMPEP_0205937788 /NCGR_PEP_ID=MMETSP1325-20131115/45063_1 /ASSEMBLY_ACC=CAM_ASM_000708 /TAXON_ID=236786 /ORGANISM="Florenciella sp., Strain RCC1007" /LENGTH=31 /DNA_ID= /DNA_START= /DNA_END= /DNA_ORIENTATION=